MIASPFCSRFMQENSLGFSMQAESCIIGKFCTVGLQIILYSLALPLFIGTASILISRSRGLRAWHCHWSLSHGSACQPSQGAIAENSYHTGRNWVRCIRPGPCLLNRGVRLIFPLTMMVHVKKFLQKISMGRVPRATPAEVPD